MLNLMVWNRTDHLYKIDLELNKLLRLIWQKNSINQPTKILHRKCEYKFTVKAMR